MRYTQACARKENGLAAANSRAFRWNAALAGTVLWAHKFGMSEPTAIERLRAQAERCLRLAKECTTPSVSETLLALAAEYLERAAKLARPAQPAVTQQQQQIQPKPGDKEEAAR
jgi:hypothetical protein